MVMECVWSLKQNIKTCNYTKKHNFKENCGLQRVNKVLLNWSITIELLRWFLAYVILECFVNFLNDPIMNHYCGSWFKILMLQDKDTGNKFY